MNRKITCMALLCLITAHYCRAQRFYFPKISANDSAAIARQMPRLAAEILSRYNGERDKMAYLDNLFRLQTIAGKYGDANKTIILLRAASKTGSPQSNSLLYIQHELFNKAKQTPPDTSFKTAFTGLFRKLFKSLDDKSAYHIYTAFMTRNGIGGLKSDFDNTLTATRQTDSLDINDALALCRNYYMLQLYQNIEPVALPLVKDDIARRYIIKNVLIKTGDGASISAIVTLTEGCYRRPARCFTIYYLCRQCRLLLRSHWNRAAYGYAAIMAYTRGKGQSPDKIVPYEDDGKDANAVIKWISNQPWCNGKIRHVRRQLQWVYPVGRCKIREPCA